jgi:hypothetical protein
MQSNRREWIMIRESILSRVDREQELEHLHHQICYQESFEQLSRIMELVDLNRYKVIRDVGGVKKYILSKDKKTFCFLLNKN